MKIILICKVFKIKWNRGPDNIHYNKIPKLLALIS